MKNKFNLLEMLIPKSASEYLDDKITVRQAVEKFAYHKYTVVPVLNENGEYIGSISEGDILRYIVASKKAEIKSYENKPVSEIERYRQYYSVNIESTFDELYSASLSQNFIPVVDDRNIFIGIVRRREIMILLKEMAEKNVEEKETN